MKYKLAKKLKDAGFPQKEFSFNNGIIGEWPTDIAPYKFPYNPTLSELIEACGDKFSDLSKIKGNKLFRATGIQDGFIHALDGETPEEAVAKLWLCIQNKNLKYED